MTISLAEEPAESEFTLSIRPESIAVGPESRARANHYEASVGDILFLGHEREVLADVGGQRLMIRSADHEIAPGDKIELGWDLDAAVIVRTTGTWRQQPQDV